jgi:hypothetical protein
MVNMRDFRSFDQLFAFDHRGLKDLVRPRVGWSWILERWSILMHPWPEVISAGLTVQFIVNDLILFDIPLFETARPLANSENADIEKRLGALEEAMKIVPPRRATEFQAPGVLFSNQHEIEVRVCGPLDDFVRLREMTKVFSLRLEGWGRNVIA